MAETAQLKNVDYPGISFRAVAYRGDSATELTLDGAVDAVHSDRGLFWAAIIAEDKALAEDLLEKKFGFHSLAVEDALSEYERPTLQQFEEYLFFALPALNKTHEARSHVEIGFFVLKHGLVTVTTQPCSIVDEWFQRWRDHPKPLNGSAAMLLHSVVDAVVDAYFPLVDDLEDELDRLSDRIFSGDITKVKEILVLKRQLLEVRRRVAPVRDIMNGLLRRDLTIIPDKVKPYFQDVLDHVIRVSELVDMNRETLASLLDVHLSQVSNNLNLVVKKMTVFATVLMIMTLVAGVYGMNFDFMPELHWRYGYPFAMGLMVVLGGVTYWLFKRFRWI